VILAVDTSTAQAGIALSGEGGPVVELQWLAGRDHSTGLFVAFKAIMDLSGLTLADVSGIAVASGPGSFSGIRVGLSAAKALALGLGIPLAAISTLDVIASAVGCPGRVWAILPAGRGQVFFAGFDGPGGTKTRTSGYRIATPEDVAAEVQPGDRLSGEGAATVRDVLATDTMVIVDRRAETLRRAGYLAELGKAYFAGGGGDQLLEAEPLYLRRSAAEEKRDAAGG
jgi:tRNA threonylcarbamoyladenosine biosynthesis protein TsaB